jgi:hypothetical protein
MSAVEWPKSWSNWMKRSVFSENSMVAAGKAEDAQAVSADYQQQLAGESPRLKKSVGLSGNNSKKKALRPPEAGCWRTAGNRREVIAASAASSSRKRKNYPALTLRTARTDSSFGCWELDDVCAFLLSPSLCGRTCLVAHSSQFEVGGSSFAIAGNLAAERFQSSNGLFYLVSFLPQLS